MQILEDCQKIKSPGKRVTSGQIAGGSQERQPLPILQM